MNFNLRNWRTRGFRVIPISFVLKKRFRKFIFLVSHWDFQNRKNDMDTSFVNVLAQKSERPWTLRIKNETKFQTFVFRMEDYDQELNLINENCNESVE